MLNHLKLGMKMLPYGANWVMQIVVMGLFFVLGLGINVLSKAFGQMNLFVGVVFMIIMGMFPAQIIYSLGVSNLVQSSPAKKRMQTSIPAVMSLVMMLAIYLVEILIDIFFTVGHPERLSAFCFDILLTAGFEVFTMLTIGIAYKYFSFALLEGVVVYFISRYSIEIQFPEFGIGTGSYLLAVLLGLILLVLGSFAQYGISLLVYRVPLSKYAQSANLRKEM